MQELLEVDKIIYFNICVSILQVLALVFIRKLMDCFFTKREMSWLDDLMPESKKKKLEDAGEVQTNNYLYIYITTCMSIAFN